MFYNSIFIFVAAAFNFPAQAFYTEKKNKCSGNCLDLFVWYSMSLRAFSCKL